LHLTIIFLSSLIVSMNSIAIKKATELASKTGQSSLWVKCADENGTCSGTGAIRYGKGSTWIYGEINGSIGCNNGVFTDPLYGTVKECWIESGSFQQCANENESCTAKNYDTVVKYGQNGKFYYKAFSANDNIGCNNGVFTDPNYGTVKTCWILTISGCFGLEGRRYLIADNGLRLARCNGCGPGANPNSVSVHGKQGDEFAIWTLESVGNKCALKSDIGQYAARCNGCWRGGAYPDSVFDHVAQASADQPWSLWTVEIVGNQYALKADTGRYMARCQGCVPGGAAPNFAFVHVDSYANASYALWTVESA